MDFIGAASGAGGRIPAPNWSMTPEALCKNYPFEFLMQPIIPLLSPPTSEEPSFCLSFPALKEACLEISRAFPKPPLQIIGVSILATSFAYGVWKVSLKLCSGIFDNEPDADPDTEKLDDEVARILSVIHEECTISNSVSCSNFASQPDLLQYVSTASSITDGLSHGTPCSCNIDIGNPLKRLQSRIDQVMSRVEVVISSLKVLEDNMTSPKPKNDGDRGDERGIVESISLNGETDIFEVSAFDYQPEKELAVATKTHFTRPNSLFGAMANIKSPDISCLCSLGTGDKEENLVNIQQRIKDLENRVESLKNISQEDILSPCDSMQSSFCSDRWDKSSSVSVLSEYNPEFVNTASSPRTLPITVQSLMSPSPQFDALTPPSDRKRSYVFKNLKRNARSRPNNFTQFPTIEEDPLSYSENADSDKVGTTLSEAGSFFGIHTSASEEEFKVDTPLKKPRRVFDVQASPVKGFNFSRQLDNVGDMKRQVTWPSLNNQYNNCKPQFIIPKINTDNSQFKQSENSCFEAMKSATDNTETAYSHTTGNTKMSFSISAPQHCQSSPRRGKMRREKNQWKSSGFGFGSSSPAKVDVISINKLPMKEKSSKIEEVSEKRMSSPFNEKQKPQQSSAQNISLTTAETDSAGELDVSKHKLETCEVVEAPPTKLSRGNVEASTVSQCTNFASKEDFQTICQITEVKEAPAASNGYQRLRRLSPFKRNSKKNNDFQVKYINKKGGDDRDNVCSVDQGDKEDEWIVIVPNESPSKSVH